MECPNPLSTDNDQIFVRMNALVSQIMITLIVLSRNCKNQWINLRTDTSCHKRCQAHAAEIFSIFFYFLLYRLFIYYLAVGLFGAVAIVVCVQTPCVWVRCAVPLWHMLMNRSKQNNTINWTTNCVHCRRTRSAGTRRGCLFLSCSPYLTHTHTQPRIQTSKHMHFLSVLCCFSFASALCECDWCVSRGKQLIVQLNLFCVVSK